MNYQLISVPNFDSWTYRLFGEDYYSIDGFISIEAEQFKGIGKGKIRRGCDYISFTMRLSDIELKNFKAVSGAISEKGFSIKAEDFPLDATFQFYPQGFYLKGINRYLGKMHSRKAKIETDSTIQFFSAEGEATVSGRITPLIKDGKLFELFFLEVKE